VAWIRVDNVAVEGRLMVIKRRKGVASSYDCYTGPCPATVVEGPDINPDNASVAVGGNQSFHCTATYQDDNGYQYPNVIINANWSSDDPSVATMSGSTATGQAGGTADIIAQSAGVCYNYDGPPDYVRCTCTDSEPYSGSVPANVCDFTIVPGSATVTCDGTEQETTFIARNSSTACTVDANSPSTYCQVTDYGSLILNTNDSFSRLNSLTKNWECHVFYTSGPTGGSLYVTASVKYLALSPAVSHSVDAEVACK